MQLNRLFRKQTGDTIVEVLIAIAVSSAVLGTAYGITNRTVKNQQQITEHSIALKLAEQQLEQLRGLAQSDLTGKVFTISEPFCISDSESQTPSIKLVSESEEVCNFDELYDVSISKTGVSDTFSAVVTWDGINGGTDRVSLDYKVYQ